MIASHRKRHLFVWLAIGIVLPVLTIAAYLLTPKFPVHDFSEQHIAFPELKRSVVSAEYVYNIKKTMKEEAYLKSFRFPGLIRHQNWLWSAIQKIWWTENTKDTWHDGWTGQVSFNLQDIEPPFSIIVKDTIRQTVLSRVDFWNASPPDY